MPNTVYLKKSSVKDKAPSAADLNYGELAINYNSESTALYFKDSDNKVIKTKLGPLDTALDETSTNGVENQAIYASISELETQLNTISQMYSIYGFARVNGDSSPDGTIFFGKEENLDGIKSNIHIGLVKDGKLYKRCANGRIDLAIDGTELLIDGSDGDVMIYTQRDLYLLKATTSVEGIGEVNVIAIGLAPFTIYGVNAKKVEPFAFNPQYTVNAKLTETNNTKGVTDYRSCAHSIYNKNVAGQYSAPNGMFGTKFKSNGNGYFHQYINSMQSVWYAQCKNEDSQTNSPYMGLYYEFMEIALGLMFMELGSVYHQGLDSFGVGCTQTNIVNASTFYDAKMSANSGLKIFRQDTDTLDYSNAYWGLMASNALQTIVGTCYYSFTECLEPQRILNDIAKAGLIDKIWKGTEEDSANQSVIFTYATDEETSEEYMTVVETDTVDLSTGEGMEDNKKYYKVRNVPKCDGMDSGSMTAVVNIYVRLNVEKDITFNNLEFHAYSAATYDEESGDELTAAAGDYAIWKFSHPVYRGISIQDGMFKQLQGFNHVRANHEGTIQSTYIYAESPDDIPAYTGASIQYFGDEDAELEIERGLNQGVSYTESGYSGWASKANYNASIFAYTATSGAAITSHEAAYTWQAASYGNGDSGTLNSNGTPREGRKCVNASVLGCYAHASVASARSLVAYRAVSYSYVDYAGAFAISHLSL
jgi:hypothetical protein